MSHGKFGASLHLKELQLCSLDRDLLMVVGRTGTLFSILS